MPTAATSAAPRPSLAHPAAEGLERLARRELDRGCDLLGVLGKPGQVPVEFDVGVVQRDRELEEVLVEVSRVVLAAGLERADQLEQGVAVEDRSEVPGFGD